MKKDALILIAALFLAGASVLRSQDDSTAAKNPVQTLQALKTANADLIDQQKKTLDGLDDTQKTADQIKTLGKRG
jgi:hypothetical protein